MGTLLGPLVSHSRIHCSSQFSLPFQTRTLDSHPEHGEVLGTSDLPFCGVGGGAAAYCYEDSYWPGYAQGGPGSKNPANDNGGGNYGGGGGASSGQR